MVERALKHHIPKDSNIKSKDETASAERIVEKLVPRLLGKPQFVNACAGGMTRAISPAVETMFTDLFRNVFMPGCDKFTLICQYAKGGVWDVCPDSSGSRKGVCRVFFPELGIKRDRGCCCCGGEGQRAKPECIDDQGRATVCCPFNVTRLTDGLKDTLSGEIQRVVSQEFSSALATSNGVSGVPLLKTPSTPVLPELDYKILLERDLEAKDYEAAFTKVCALVVDSVSRRLAHQILPVWCMYVPKSRPEPCSASLAQCYYPNP